MKKKKKTKIKELLVPADCPLLQLLILINVAYLISFTPSPLSLYLEGGGRRNRKPKTKDFNKINFFYFVLKFLGVSSI
jgi:hypothetical protein